MEQASEPSTPNAGMGGVIFVFIFIVGWLVILLCSTTVVRGYYVGAGWDGLNCVYADHAGGDSALFCSDDIFAVQDALRRYRRMPLGTLRREKP